MSTKQISAFLENKPGKLSELTSLLAANGIDLRALSLAETNDFGIARMIVDDVEKASAVLANESFIASVTEVLVFAVPDEPGGLNRLLTEFNKANVNIIYMYAFIGRDTSRAYMIFRVSDTASAERALSLAGLSPLTQSEMDAI